MRKPLVLSTVLAVYLMSSPSRDYGQKPIPPGLHEGEKQISAPIEPPAKFERKPPDRVILKKEAEELAKLSAGVPSQVDQVSQGKIPKDLSDQLKRIEKLAKHLRSEIAP